LLTTLSFVKRKRYQRKRYSFKKDKGSVGDITLKVGITGEEASA